MATAPANPGTAASVTSRAVVARSSVLPIRAAASLSQPGPGRIEARCAVTSAPLPGPASGSQRRATGSPPAPATASVPAQDRPAATSPSAWSASSRSPGPASSASRTSRPLMTPAGRPNSSAAAAGQQETRPRESRVNAAKPAGPAPGMAGSRFPAAGNSTGACTSLDPPSRPNPPLLRRSIRVNGRSHLAPRRCGGARRLRPYSEISCKREMYRITGVETAPALEGP